MMEYCEGHQTLYHQGTAFVTTVCELMQLLLEYRAVVCDSDNRDCMMCCTVNLLASVFQPSVNQSCIFRLVPVIQSRQDPLEVVNNLPGINGNVRERGLEQKCF